MELLFGFSLILLTGYYAGTETALYRANWLRLLNWAKMGRGGAKDALRALEKPNESLVASLIGTNLASVFATQLFEHYFVREFGAIFTPLVIGVVLLFTLILGDYLPKALAQAVPTGWLRGSAVFLNFTRMVFAPLISVLTRLLPRVRSPDLVREDYLNIITQSSSSPTSIRNMTARLFRFSQMKVVEAGVPLRQVKSVSRDASREEVLALLQEYGFTRIPVYEGKKDNIVGVIVTRDLLLSEAVGFRPVLRVKPETRALEVLKLMQRRGEHLAVLENEAGWAIGIVTLEDLVEELVGEIRSED